MVKFLQNLKNYKIKRIIHNMFKKIVTNVFKNKNKLRNLHVFKNSIQIFADFFSISNYFFI